jgi:hypothetical protein
MRDHERLCQGREYTCTCGYDAERDNLQAELLECLKAMVAETVEYATINKLGDPEKQHNIKWARSIIAKAEGGAA